MNGGCMSFVPENKLEESLQKAATDPAHRPQFYQDLIESDIFAIQHVDQGEDPVSSENNPEGKTIKIAQVEYNGVQCIPIFTAPIRIKSAVQNEVSYLGINALEFMRVTNGDIPLLLNLGSEFGKEFSKGEIKAILENRLNFGTMEQPPVNSESVAEPSMSQQVEQSPVHTDPVPEPIVSQQTATESHAKPVVENTNEKPTSLAGRLSRFFKKSK